jgi:dihydroxy-acid dehydratase
MKELQSLLKINQATVEGNVDARIEFARPADGNVIRTFDKPYSPTGGIMVLKGNLAPGGSVMKASGVDSGVKEFTGQAAVFENEEAATAFIKSGQLKPGTVLVIKNEGPAGGPGMREMLYPTSAVRGLKMDKEVALITDGRFSGGTAGICIGHVEPEAFNAGPIAAVKNGDKIVIDLVAKTVTLCVEEQEIRRRLQWLPAAKELPKGGILEKFRKVYRNCKA